VYLTPSACLRCWSRACRCASSRRVADALARHPTLRDAATAPPRPRQAVDLPQIPALALGYAERGPPTL
jgi:hypothetical protein